MARTGWLETMARDDLDALLATVGRHYQPGALEALSAADPAWREAVERAEHEVGSLHAALREADLTVARWREAVTELARLWARVGEVRLGDEEAATLAEVA